MHTKSIVNMLLCLVAATTWAQGPNNTGTYYRNANGKKGAELKTAMHNIIKSPNVTSYKGLTEAYKKTDTRPDGFVRDWYSNTTNYRHGIDTGQYSKEGDSYNKEHTVPQSWFSEASPMKSDIVQVVPTDGYVNNRRGNYPFGETNNPTYQSNNGYSKLGPCATSGYSGTVFEPNDEIKGDIARIYFYMATCYEDRCTNWGHVFSQEKYPGLVSWTLNMMMQWAAQDPVDSIEHARNNAVQEVQGNRNPFVDYPGLEAYVWGAKQDSLFNYEHFDSGIIPTPDPDPNPDPDPEPEPNPQPDIDPETIYIYNKVAQANELTTGDGYLIVCENASNGAQALAGYLTNSTKALSGVGVTILGTQISTSVNSAGKPHELILGGTTNNYTFYDTADSVYIGLNSNGNALHQLTSNTEQGAHWTITLSNGVCDILNNGYEDRYLRYNNSSPRFACYTSGQYPVVLYKRAATTGIVASQWLTSEREEQVSVYSIDGRRVCSANNKKDALRQLTKGIYIVNGRKMVVK